jgi:hypothetical protein
VASCAAALTAPPRTTHSASDAVGVAFRRSTHARG